MNDEEWEIFVNEGVISKKMAVTIAYKIYSSIKLTDREMSAYVHHSDTVEDIIRKIKMIENVQK